MLNKIITLFFFFLVFFLILISRQFPLLQSDGNQTEDNINPVIKKGGGGGGGHGGGGGGHAGGSSGGHGSGGKGGGSRGGGSEGGGGKGGGGKGGGNDEGYSKSKPGPTKNVPRSGAGQSGEKRKQGHPEPPDFPRGTIVTPRGHVKGVPPKYSKTEDPDDETLNWKLLYAGYIFIHDLNPCDRYQERLDSKKNGRRKHGCRKEATRMKKANKEVQSSNCQDVAEGRCFQVSGQSGRCYIRVNSNRPDQGNWELPDKCQTSAAPPPPTEAPPPGGTPLQPAAQPPNQFPVPNTPQG
ncbi:uncharacterized protein [Bemisia tabaci]|uniref:uncharacterized protein n=1 Tax=Bemisia tabaci TaxID=7038 RepID=UPI003B27ECA1